MPDPVPITCARCGTCLARTDGRHVRTSERAVAVGKVTLLCCNCGGIRVIQPTPKPLDRSARVRSIDS